ncbi:hypothetical protein SprV_0100237700 [Sparganum proliferum]
MENSSGAEMYAVKVKRAARKSSASPTYNTNTETVTTCPRYRRTSCVPIGLIGHLRTHCNNKPTTPPLPSTNTRIIVPASTPTTATAITSVTSSYTPNALAHELTSSTLIIFIIPVTTNATTATTSSTLTTSENTPDAPSDTTLTTTAPTTSNVDSMTTCSHCDSTFASHISLIGRPHAHQGHRNSKHCRKAMGALCTQQLSHHQRANISIIGIATGSAAPNLPYPHRLQTCSSNISLVGYMRVRRTESGGQVPEAQTLPTAPASTAHTADAYAVIEWPTRPHAYP